MAQIQWLARKILSQFCEVTAGVTRKIGRLLGFRKCNYSSFALQIMLEAEKCGLDGAAQWRAFSEVM